MRLSIRLLLITAFLISAGCTSTDSQRLSDEPVGMQRLAVMADFPDSDMRKGFEAGLREALADRDILVTPIRPSRDPRPERIAQYGGDVDATAVLYAGATYVSTREAIARQQFASQDHEVVFTLYSVASERRVWTANTKSSYTGSQTGGRFEIGARIAYSAVGAMKKDGLL